MYTLLRLWSWLTWGRTVQRGPHYVTRRLERRAAHRAATRVINRLIR